MSAKKASAKSVKKSASKARKKASASTRATKKAGKAKTAKAAKKKTTKKKSAKKVTKAKATKKKTAKKVVKKKTSASKASKAPKAKKRTSRKRRRHPQLTPKVLEGLRRRLLEKRRELIGSVASSAGDRRDQKLDGTEDYIDYAVNSYDREFLLSLTELDQKELLLVEDALRRMDRGEYGYCMASGDEIPLKRLEVQPWARYSVHNQDLVDQGLLPDTLFRYDVKAVNDPLDDDLEEDDSEDEAQDDDDEDDEDEESEVPVAVEKKSGAKGR